MPDVLAVPRTQDRMSHDVWLPAETIELRAHARTAVEKHVAPVARAIGAAEESPDSFPWEAFRGLADEGLFAVPFPAPEGSGLQFPMLGTCTVTEEIAYHSSSLAGVYDGQCILVPQAISFAQPQVRAALLPDLISGQGAYSFATTEPDASSDLSNETLQTELTDTADGYVLNGRKRWITNACVAQWAAVLCKHGDRATMVLVDLTNTPGVRVGAP